MINVIFFSVIVCRRELLYFDLCPVYLCIFYLTYFQNYFGDPWNVLDFVIVIGSVIDIMLGKLMVSASLCLLYLIP